MTIADIPRRAIYTFSSGASYPFGFVVFGTDEVTITVADVDGVETVLDASLYTVTLNDNGGTVVLDESVECANVVITSAVPQTQESIITNKGGFYPDVLNKAHDKLTALIQQVDEKVERAIKVPVSSYATADEYKGEIEAIANEAKASAEQAASSAASAEARATSAESLATQASEDASGAVEQAQQAVTTAGNAVTSASSAVTTANNASALSNDAVTTAMQAKTQAQTASSNASTAITRADAASASAQSSYQAVQSIQASLPSDIEEEVARQIGSELQTTVYGIVRQVAPDIIEETAASKDYVDTALSGEAAARASAVSAEETARADADTALGQRITTLDNSLKNVAKTGSYNDLTDKPTIPAIPTNVSAFTNDAEYTSKTYVDEAIENIDALPDQTGQAGKCLMTDGEKASWEYGGGVGHHILEIFTTSRTDPAPINGAYDCNGAWYNKSDFTGENSPYDMLVAGKAKTCTNDEYEYELGQKGSCGKYVVDTANQRFRVPTINNIIQPTVLASAIGEICDAGLPNHTHERGTMNITGYFGGVRDVGRAPYGAFYKDTNNNGAGSGIATYSIGFDASRSWTGETSGAISSSGIYRDDINTVQPQTIYARAMVQLATAGQEISIQQYEQQLSQYAQTAMINGRILGETIESLVPLTDAGIHLFDGASIQKSGIYTKFTHYVENLEASNPDLFVTQAEFNASVNAYGVCSKFVNGDSYIRLPKLYSETRYLVKAWKSGTEWYNLYSDGWVEQGGYVKDNTAIQFRVSFKDTDYTLVATTAVGTGDVVKESSESRALRTNASAVLYFSGSTYYGCWEACGYALETPESEKIYRYICVATSVKTPVEVNIDNIITDNNNKADRDLSNCTSPILSAPYVVETWKSDDGSSWYRKWSDGWIEQGGILTCTSADNSKVVTFKLPFSNTNYQIQTTIVTTRESASYDGEIFVRAKTTTTFTAGSRLDNSSEYMWHAFGY